MSTLAGKRIVVGVAGGIAAYKSADLVRRLREREAEVRVVMTPNATEFITPLTLQAVSGSPVHLELLDAEAESGMGHIELARWAEAVVIAPATANVIARLAHGLGDDLLTTLCLATEAKLALAPAMNRLMWSHAATRENVSILEGRGAHILGPGTGNQACGESGPGRMLEPAELADRIALLFEPPFLEGIRVMVTAGPTWEAIDPVRGLTNHSSGKMGYAIAEAAAAAGAEVCLVSGPTHLDVPRSVTRIDVLSASEMDAAVQERVADYDIFVAVAAVADYRPAEAKAQKIKKNAERLTLELTRNPDILARVAARSERPFTVGFAAETQDVVAYARQKLLAKGIDLIAANLVGGDNGGFGADENSLTLIDRRSSIELPRENKRALAAHLIHHIAERFRASRTTQDSRPASA